MYQAIDRNSPFLDRRSPEPRLPRGSLVGKAPRCSPSAATRRARCGIPACMTGTVGLKVTLGRWPADGVVPLSPTFDTPGLLARSVCDVAYGFAALDPAGIDPIGFIARAGTRDISGVRIGVGDPFLWRDCDPGIAETAHEAVNALSRAGAVTREFTLPEAEAAYTLFLQGSLSAVELRSFLDRELPDWLAQLDPVIAPALRDAESLSAR